MIFAKRALLAALWLYAMVIFAHFRLPFGARSQLAFSFPFSYSILAFIILLERGFIRYLRCAEWELERKKGNYREISLKFLLFFLFLDGRKEDFIEKSR